MALPYKLLRMHKDPSGPWQAMVEIAGQTYVVSLQRGSHRVRMAFAGRRYGYHWYGYVTADPSGKRLLCEQVPKNAGLRYLLELAGLVKQRRAEALKGAKKTAFSERLARTIPPGVTYAEWGAEQSRIEQARVEQLMREWTEQGLVEEA